MGEVKEKKIHMKLWHVILLAIGVLILVGGILGLLFPNLYSGILRVFDNPDYSEEEVCALIWAKLPAEVGRGYSKADFYSNTRAATYQGDGKWLFEVSGLITESFIEFGGEERTRTREYKPKDRWDNPFSYKPIEVIEQQYRDVIERYRLKLKANFYEKTGIVEVMGIYGSLVERSTGEWTW